MHCCLDNSDMYADRQVEPIVQPFVNFPLSTDATKTWLTK